MKSGQVRQVRTAYKLVSDSLALGRFRELGLDEVKLLGLTRTGAPGPALRHGRRPVHHLHQGCQEARRGPQVNPVRCDTFSVAVQMDLVRLAGWEALLEIAERR